MSASRSLWFVLVCSVLLALAGCAGASGSGGGGGGSGSSDPRAAVMGCLQKTGLQAQPNDATPLGVDDPTEGITVTLQSQDFHESYEAEIWLFQSHAIAEKDRPAITLQTQDDIRNKVLGKAVVEYSIVPDKQDTKQVEACL
jgi:hypothetical protein